MEATTHSAGGGDDGFTDALLEAEEVGEGIIMAPAPPMGVMPVFMPKYMPMGEGTT